VCLTLARSSTSLASFAESPPKSVHSDSEAVIRGFSVVRGDDEGQQCLRVGVLAVVPALEAFDQQLPAILQLCVVFVAFSTCLACLSGDSLSAFVVFLRHSHSLTHSYSRTYTYTLTAPQPECHAGAGQGSTSCHPGPRR
jgi:hypothetical protein